MTPDRADIDDSAESDSLDSLDFLNFVEAVTERTWRRAGPNLGVRVDFPGR